MAADRKIMFSARIPRELLARLDHVVRNTEAKSAANRSRAIQTALEDWLPGLEIDIGKRLGTAAPKIKSA